MSLKQPNLRQAFDTSDATKRIADLPHFPFSTFADLQQAISSKTFSLGVDSLAAAEWADQFSSPMRRYMIGAMSLLLVLLTVASVVAALVLERYLLLAALPIVIASFVYSHPSQSIHKWVSVASAFTAALFIVFLAHGFGDAALLAAYSLLTFGVVRIVALITDSSFRRALMSDEHTFVAAYTAKACTIRENETMKVFASE